MRSVCALEKCRVPCSVTRTAVVGVKVTSSLEFYFLFIPQSIKKVFHKASVFAVLVVISSVSHSHLVSANLASSSLHRYAKRVRCNETATDVQLSTL